MDGHYAPDQPPFLKPVTGRVAFTSNPDIILQILVYHFHIATKNQADAKMHAEAFALSDSPFKTLPKLNPACFQTEYLRMFFFEAFGDFREVTDVVELGSQPTKVAEWV